MEIALALSGGGIRAMAFHTGVLRFLAERRKLEAVRHISTVSGGSLLAGFIFSRSNMKWPDSSTYLDVVRPAIRSLLTTYDLQFAAIGRLIVRAENWPFIFSRANIVAQAIYEDWRVRQTLSELPASPVWSINGTTAESGKRFRFKYDEFGDYELGYTLAEHFPLASAMAVSAAFPIGIGPLVINTSRYEWRKRPWGAPLHMERVIKLPYKRLHVYDGGVYDNLGLEPLYDIGKQASKVKARIIASDAGAPLSKGFNLAALNPFRIKRLMDVVTDQTRSLRIRSFIEYLKRGNRGVYLGIGHSPKSTLIAAGISNSTFSWLPDEAAALVRHYPTNLRQIEPETFDLLEQHGYEAAFSAELAHQYLR